MTDLLHFPVLKVLIALVGIDGLAIEGGVVVSLWEVFPREGQLNNKHTQLKLTI